MEEIMARVQGVKEKLHSPLYDAFFVPGGPANGNPLPKKFHEVMTDPRVIRFFVDVQNKTRLETNLQAAGVLPSLNNFEARALRVVVSNPQCSIDYKEMWTAVKTYRSQVAGATPKAQKAYTDDELDEAMCRKIEELCRCSSAHISSILAELIYNSVTTLLVGEKTMIEMPTYFFPAGAGVSPGTGPVINHGEPDPMATFRFSEPVMIEPQQNFRVEMLFPRDVPDIVREAPGPLRIWVVLDGYLTRDVQ
jgi:hypothetical protein